MDAEKSKPVGRIPSGLFIVTAILDDQEDGFLASWIQQASFTPLLLSVAMKPGRPCYDAVKAHGRFVVNIVDEANKGLLKNFWKGYSPDESPFADLEHEVVEGQCKQCFDLLPGPVVADFIGYRGGFGRFCSNS